VDEMIQTINSYPVLLCNGGIPTLNARVIRHDRRVTGQPAVCTTESAEPKHLIRLISSVAVDPSRAEKFLADNPEMLTADQCQRMLTALGAEHAGWLATFNRMLATATIQSPGKAFLFSLGLTRPCVSPAPRC
jgi:hypothetical protein